MFCSGEPELCPDREKRSSERAEERPAGLPPPDERASGTAAEPDSASRFHSATLPSAFRQAYGRITGEHTRLAPGPPPML
jgi:hypothetical protein